MQSQRNLEKNHPFFGSHWSTEYGCLLLHSQEKQSPSYRAVSSLNLQRGPQATTNPKLCSLLLNQRTYQKIRREKQRANRKGPRANQSRTRTDDPNNDPIGDPLRASQ